MLQLGHPNRCEKRVFLEGGIGGRQGLV
jgi:hypothetical protein